MRSVAQAIRDAQRKGVPQESGVFTCWRSEVFAGKTRRSRKSPWRHNLTTTTAAGYTNANDWLSKLMGAGESTVFASAAGSLTAVSATSATNSGATFPTAGQGLAGQWVIAAQAGGQLSRMKITSNSSTVLTGDQWYSGTSTTGAVGTTPSATGAYMILTGQGTADWMAVTTDATAPTTADTTLASELTTNGFSRAVGTWAHTANTSTFTLIHLWTATGTDTINKEAQFGAANTTAGGVMPFESAEPSPPTLVSGDTLQNTVTITV